MAERKQSELTVITKAKDLCSYETVKTDTVRIINIFASVSENAGA